MNNQSGLIGVMMASANDEIQAEILNEFVSALTVMGRASQFGGIGMQSFYIARRLRPETVNFLKELIESYEYRCARLPEEIVELEARREQLRQDIEHKEKQLYREEEA